MVTEIVRQEEFEGMQLSVIEQNGEEWFSAEDIGKALGMAEPRQTVVNLFNRNRDEFEGLYRVIGLMTWLKSGLKTPRRFTTFNPQGAYLLAILARTEKSKALRRWLARFMAKDLNRLKEHVATCEAQHEADQTLIGELEAEAQRHRDEVLKGATWDTLPEIPDWYWDFNRRVKPLQWQTEALEQQVMALEQKVRALEAAPTGKLATIPENLVLITTKDLRRLRDMGGAEAQRIMHDTLTAQAEWDTLVKGLRHLDKLKLN